MLVQVYADDIWMVHHLPCRWKEKKKRGEESVSKFFFQSWVVYEDMQFRHTHKKKSLKSLKLLTRHGVLFRRSLRPVHPFILILKSTVNRLPFNRTLGFCCHLLVYMWSVRQKNKQKKNYKMRWKLIVFLRNYFSEQRTFLHGGCCCLFIIIIMSLVKPDPHKHKGQIWKTVTCCSFYSCSIPLF